MTTGHMHFLVTNNIAYLKSLMRRQSIPSYAIASPKAWPFPVCTRHKKLS